MLTSDADFGEHRGRWRPSPKDTDRCTARDDKLPRHRWLERSSRGLWREANDRRAGCARMPQSR
ncbi:MAG: hypothetical protein D6725_15355 [Planctomycetota bacterium]|nr:MAG: hypothetical protein D6725_15355 [Planctomycetota bacterium]